MTSRRLGRLPLAVAIGGFAVLVGVGPPSADASAKSSRDTGGGGTSTRVAARAEASAQSLLCSRYAAPGGSDRSRGTRTRPFRTVQRLADSLRSGETGCLRAGVYDDVDDDGYVLRVGHGGAPGAPITIRSYPRERGKLVGIVNVPKDSNHVRLSGLAIRGTGGGQNSVKIYATHVVVQKSRISNAGRGDSCMILGNTSGYGQASAVIVHRNRFHDCGSVAHDNKDHAIYVSNAIDTRIVGNIFWATSGYTIHLYPNARRTHVAHNVIDGGAPSSRGGVLFGGDSDYASSGNIVEYNVIAFSRTYNITSTWSGATGSGNIARRNCIWGGREGNIDASDGGFARNENTVAPPRFVNREERDYRLRQTSRCRAVVGYDAAARLP